MDNFGLNLNKIKQPEPDISNNNSERIIKNPYVGIISNINPTSTPTSDTLVLKSQEIPKSNYNPFKRKNASLNLNNLATSGIIGCGILALLSLIKNIKSKK